MPNRWGTNAVSPVMVQLSAWRQSSDLVAGMCVCAQLGLTLWPCGLYPPRLLCPRDSQQEYWSGLPCPPPGDFPIQAPNPHPSRWQVDFHDWATEGDPRYSPQVEERKTGVEGGQNGSNVRSGVLKEGRHAEKEFHNLSDRCKCWLNAGLWDCRYRVLAMSLYLEIWVGVGGGGSGMGWSGQH